MRTTEPVRAGLMLAALALFVACGKDEKLPSAPGTGGTSGAAGNAGTGGGGASGSGGTSGTLEHCLERPTDLPRPPNGKLPCELIPPGLSLPGN